MAGAMAVVGSTVWAAFLVRSPRPSSSQCRHSRWSRRCRYWGAFDNHGELVNERTDAARFFDLRPSGLLSSLADRLVTEGSKDAINWAKRGNVAAAFPVIADPQNVEFPGFDRLALTRADLRVALEDSRYAAWRTALGSVQGVHIAGIAVVIPPVPL